MSRTRRLTAVGVIAFALTGLALTARAQGGAAAPNFASSRAGDNGLVREVRVALVCYGGSSLAIYIHGNAKELHRLVLASKALQIDALANQSQMQRDIAEDPSNTRKHEAGAAGRALTGSTRVWYDRLLSLWLSDPKRVRTRVVVDVVAGTSAGGINGVILAKALAHDLSQDSLTALWMEKASLRRLTDNYFGFFRVLGGGAPINGNAMVGWLFEALDGMDRQATAGLGTHSLLPDGDRLDLFVTTTDLKGYPQQVVVNDPPLASEKHFPHVLHFIYSGHKQGCAFEPKAGLDDFCPAWTPSLAFAARASSSIPGVFPPLSLDETLTQLKALNPNLQPIPGVAPAPSEEEVVRSFFRNYQLQEPTGGVSYATNTLFVDGGVLDNHPFGPAIEEIRRRPNDQEVKRVLLYLQPDPGKPPSPPKREEKPGLLGTVWAGLSGIPSNQPILNDLNDILSYNERVRRIADIVGSEEAATESLDREGSAAALTCKEPEKLNEVQRLACASKLAVSRLGHDSEALDHAEALSVLRKLREDAEIAADKGVTDLAGQSYYALRVHSVLNQFAEVISDEKVCYYPPDSAHRALVATIIDEWARRKELIGKAHDPQAQKMAQVEFLKDFDVGYQRRQLRFVNEWIDEQYAAKPAQEERKALDELKSAAASRIWDLTLLVRGQAPDPALVAQVKKMKELFVGLRPWDRVDGKPATLATLAKLFVDKHQDELDALRTNLGNVLRDLQQQVRDDSYKDFKTKVLALPPHKQPQILMRYFGFPFWDRQIYPLVAFSDIGEFATIDVIRLSPDDATLLGGGTAQQKLVGAKTAHFGAFFSRPGRESDYVWGRLDAAERLLTMLEIPTADRKPKELLQSIIEEVRAKEGSLIRESILKQREDDIKAHLPD